MQTLTPDPTPEPAPDPEAPQPMRSVFTAGLPELLARAGISLAVTTYQAGKLVFLRAVGSALNTHFRAFERPMGLALKPGVLAVGTAVSVAEFHQTDFQPPDADSMKADACYLPRQSHFTGNVQIHEMAWGGDDLWFVNTRFSCLCTRSLAYSFLPRWRPPFISALAAEDRCHLNGLAMLDGQPGFVTMMGLTDTEGGWRVDKIAGGVVMSVADDEVVTRGLSMPHSPRLYDGNLFVLNSGEGGLGYVDRTDGHYREIVRLPGFTRGLDFHGPYAFVGLSQVRESAVFSGIAIAKMPTEERRCGVWVVDLRTGAVAGFVRFEDAVQEVFAVQVMPHAMPDLVNETKALSDLFILSDETMGMMSSRV